MSDTKMTQNRPVVHWNASIQILLFIVFCFTLPRCSVVERQLRPEQDSPATTHAEGNLRKEIVRYARQFVGTGYQYAGRKPATGFDCSGFTWFVMHHFNIELTPVSRAQENEGRKITLKEARPGDLIFFRRTKNGPVFHVGLIISNGPQGVEMIHSSSSRGVVIDRIRENSYWKTKIATARNVID